MKSESNNYCPSSHRWHHNKHIFFIMRSFQQAIFPTLLFFSSEYLVYHFADQCLSFSPTTTGMCLWSYLSESFLFSKFQLLFCPRHYTVLILQEVCLTTFFKMSSLIFPISVLQGFYPVYLKFLVAISRRSYSQF